MLGKPSRATHTEGTLQLGLMFSIKIFAHQPDLMSAKSMEKTKNKYKAHGVKVFMQSRSV